MIPFTLMIHLNVTVYVSAVAARVCEGPAPAPCPLPLPGGGQAALPPTHTQGHGQPLQEEQPGQSKHSDSMNTTNTLIRYNSNSTVSSITFS